MILYTKIGRATLPMPEVRKGKFLQTDISKLCEWLLKEATEEAFEKGDRQSEYLFVNMHKNLTPEEFDLASEYLFGTGLKGYDRTKQIKH